VGALNGKRLVFIDDTRFVDADPQTLPNLEFQFEDGTVMKPISKEGKIVAFEATDKTGNSVPLVRLQVGQTDVDGIVIASTCYSCRCNGSCHCVEVPCGQA
jgi:hypothetical protein